MIRRKAIFLSVVLFLTASLSSCDINNKYVNQNVGYEITGPAGWVNIPTDENSVSFCKYRGKKYGNNSVNTKVQLKDPDNSDLMYYFSELFLPNTLAFLREDGKAELIEGPNYTEIDGKPWVYAKLRDSGGIFYVYEIFYNDWIIDLICYGVATAENDEPEDADILKAAVQTFKFL